MFRLLHLAHVLDDRVRVQRAQVLAERAERRLELLHGHVAVLVDVDDAPWPRRRAFRAPP